MSPPVGKAPPAATAPLHPVTPIAEGAPDYAPYAKPAGGLDAVLTSTRYVLNEAGVVRGTRALLRVNQDGGFDCPSCAWPDPKERSVAEFCENGAKAVGDEATTRRVPPSFFAEHTIAQLAAQTDRWLNAQGRITHPMVRREDSGRYEPIAWEDAFELVAAALGALSDPDRAAFYTSGRASNEAAFLWQLFARQLGTNNLPDCSNMCHESSGSGLSEVLGITKGSVSLDDFAVADAIFVIGQNPGTNHPRMLTTLREAKLRGAAIVVLNPIEEAGLVRFRHPQHVEDLVGPGVALGDLHLKVRIGGDVAALAGIMKALVERDDASPGAALDHDFLQRHARGHEELAAHLRALSWGSIALGSGVAQAELERAADVAQQAKGIIACWAMGVTQHKHAVGTVQQIANLLLLRGAVGKPGAGPCPVRGHSNVQGDRTMGVWEKVPRWIDALEREAGFTAPRREGLDTVGAIGAMIEGELDVLLCLGGNLLSAGPDTEAAAEGFRRARLTVAIGTKLNRSMVVPGRAALILPCLGRTERDVQDGVPQVVTVEDSMSMVHASEGRLPPASPELRSEVAIVCGLAAATLGDRSRVPWSELARDYRRVRAMIERVVPDFEGYEERARQPGGFRLPSPAAERRFLTASGKAELTVHPLPQLDVAPGQLVMMTIRSHDQFNTVVYADDDRYRGLHRARNAVLVHAADLAALGLAAGDRVAITSHFQGETRTVQGFVCVPYPIARGCCATYFPEANALVPLGSFADVSRTPTSKSVAVSLRPSSSPARTSPV